MVAGLAASNSAENEWCARAGTAAAVTPRARANKATTPFLIYILLSNFRVGCPDNNRPATLLQQPTLGSNCLSTLWYTPLDHQRLPHTSRSPDRDARSVRSNGVCRYAAGRRC